MNVDAWIQSLRRFADTDKVFRSAVKRQTQRAISRLKEIRPSGDAPSFVHTSGGHNP